jgi:hypothetical protein
MYEIKQTLKNSLLVTEIWRVKEMPAHTSWSSYGSETPELQSFAIKVLSQVIVALACERKCSICV